MSSYDFSPVFLSSVLEYSPGSTFLATAHIDRIIVRSTTTLQIVRTWHCLPTTPSTSKTPAIEIDTLSWSNDGLYLLAFSSKAGLAWIFGIADEGNGECGEVARIGEGIEGMINIEWGRGVRDVLAWSDYGIKLTIFDLLTGLARVVQHPKSPTKCHTFSSNGRYMAVAERHSGKEYIGIYDSAAGYQMLRHFPILTTDIQGLIWSPCGSYLAAYDSALCHSLHIYSPLGLHLALFSDESKTFSHGLHSEDPGLGMKSITWAPGGRFLAIGGWDGKVRILESDGWRCVAVINIANRIDSKDVTIHKEPSDWISETRGRGIVQFNRQRIPAPLPSLRSDISKYPSRGGVSQISFSPQASHVLVRLDTQPNVAHIYTFLPDLTSHALSLQHVAALIFTATIRCAKWSLDVEGKGKKAALTTRNGAIYIWDGETGWVEEGESEGELKGGYMEGVGIPARTSFAAHQVHYSPDGKSLAIMDKNQFCLMYEVDDDGLSEHGAEGKLSKRWTISEGLSHVMEEEEEEEGGAVSRMWQSHGIVA